MLKKSYFMSLLLVAILILGACGTSSDDGKTTGNSSGSNEPDVENNEDENGLIEDDEDDDSEEDIEDEIEDSEESDEPSSEGTTETEEDSNDFEENAQQVDSDAQDFSIQILPEYTLTSEEPGRDSLYLTEDGNIFMRIETAPFAQEDYDYFKENIVTTLETTRADGEEVAEVTEQDKLPQADGVKNAVGYSVKANESELTGIVFEKDGLLVRLTMFDTLDNEHYNNFLQMGQTITNK